jgi:hypothetical protein
MQQFLVTLHMGQVTLSNIRNRGNHQAITRHGIRHLRLSRPHILGG